MPYNDDLNALDPRTRALIQDRLVDGESILGVTHIHKGIYWSTIAVALLTLLAGVFIAPQLMIVLGGAAALMGLYAFWRQKFFIMVLTDKRILARYGVLQMDMVDMRFDKIESMETEQMLPGYLMGYANLVVMGTGNRYITIPYVANAADMRKKFNEIVLKD